MQPVAATRPAPVAQPSTPPAAAADATRAGGGVQGLIGDALRGAGAGYAHATRLEAVQADKAAIHPFEAVTTATGLLKQKTANVPVLGRASSILHTVGGFAMLILTANVAGTLRAPGQTGAEIANAAADLIDGRDTSKGFSMGWFATPQGAGEQPPALPEGSVGAALGALGMR